MIDILLSYKAVWRILMLMTESPGKGYYRDDLLKMTKLNNLSLDSALKKSVYFELVKKEGRTYRLNHTNKYFKRILSICKDIRSNLRDLDYDTYIILNKLLRSLLDKTHIIKKVILFGSYAQKIPRKTSDIDICIITKAKKPEQEIIMTQVIDKIEKKVGREIQPHFFTEKEFETARKQKQPLVINIIKDGIELK